MKTQDQIESEIEACEDRLRCAQMAEADIECWGDGIQIRSARRRIKNCERELWALKDKL